MKQVITRLFIMLVLAGATGTATAQFNINIKKAVSGVSKAAKAFTLSDKDMAAYVERSVQYMDSANTVMPDSSAYVQRLRRLTSGIKDADGIALNFKVYDVSDINAFACPDGSVRVFSSLMDMMDDDELMGIIGHEIGHVMKRHSRNAFRNELLGDALKDFVSSANATAAALTESQLSALGKSLLNARYSQKQELEADNCGYDFLRDHGRNPWGMVMAFEKLQKLEGGNGMTYIQKMFSSHPETKKRIEKMTERLNKEGIARPQKAEIE